MIYRRFGRTELQMPVFTCGTMRFQESWEDLGWDQIKDKTQQNLEAVVRQAFELGMNHFETARGYGTSELQLGRALKLLPRDEIIVQSKIPLRDTAKEFEETLTTTFARLDIDYLDLCALHGVNGADAVKKIEHCVTVLKQWRERGKIGHIGFSTHDKGEYAQAAIATDYFDYVNLHYYYISQENLSNIELAKQHDMGIFIISPNDKGGKLYAPPEKLLKLTAPLSPMQFNDLFCLLNPNINTLSLGIAEPSNLTEHLEVIGKLELDAIDETRVQIAQITGKLDREMREALGKEWVGQWSVGLPDYKEVPGEINIFNIIWLYNLAKGLDLVEYGKMRYNLLGSGGVWFPGNKAENIAELGPQIIALCQKSGSPFAEKIPKVLMAAHEMFNVVEEGET